MTDWTDCCLLYDYFSTNAFILFCSHTDSLHPFMNPPACRLCLYCAAWPLAATSAVACVAAVTAAVEDVNHGLERTRTRIFTCPPRTWRLSCSLTREVRLNHLCRHFSYESVRGLLTAGGSTQTLKMLYLCQTEAGGDPIMLQPSATETTQLTSDGHHSYHTDTGFN